MSRNEKIAWTFFAVSMGLWVWMYVVWVQTIVRGCP